MEYWSHMGWSPTYNLERLPFHSEKGNLTNDNTAFPSKMPTLGYKRIVRSLCFYWKYFYYLCSFKLICLHTYKNKEIHSVFPFCCPPWKAQGDSLRSIFHSRNYSLIMLTTAILTSSFTTFRGQLSLCISFVTNHLSLQCTSIIYGCYSLALCCKVEWIVC